MLIKLKRVVQATVTAFVALLLLTSPALATPANPDSIALNTAKVFQNIFTDGDRLFVGEFNIDYISPGNPEPDEDATDAFLLQLRSADGTTLIRATGVTDYQWNLTSIYFTPAQVTSANITWETSYKVRVTGNPALFGTLTEGTNMATKTLSPTDWNTDGTLTSSELLRLYCIDVAARMEDDSGVTLLATTASGVSVLNPTGTILFLAAIPSLSSALPGLFQVSSSTTNLPAVPVVATYEEATTIGGKLGTSIENSFKGIGEWLIGVDNPRATGMAAGLWIMLLMLTVMSIVFLNSGSTTGAIILAIPIAAMGAYVGAIPLTLLLTVGLLAVAYTGYFIWLRGT